MYADVIYDRGTPLGTLTGSEVRFYVRNNISHLCGKNNDV